MIQESDEDVRSRILGDIESSDFGIEKENLGMAYKAFIQYSNPIGSIVREITSNAWDAIVDAGNNDPVVIEMSQKYPPDDERWIAFHDTGVGLVPLPAHTPDGREAKEMYKRGKISEDRLREILNIIEKKIKEANVPSMLVYKNFFSSTKRDIIDQLGYFGLGAKSPLGYADMFEIITRRAGWKYHYSVRKGKEKPQLDLLSVEETDRGNGTTVRVPIKSANDHDRFIDSIETQLAYFDNVVFEGGASGTKVTNDFTIYRGNHIIYRPDSPFDKMHICLGTVYYPLDYDVMGIREGYHNSRTESRSGHHTPIGLYFPLEDQKEMPIKVVWNRESIEYNSKTKESIQSKLEKAKEELQDLYDQQYNDISTIKEWYEYVAADSGDHIIVNDDVKIPITNDLVEEPDIMPPGFENFFEKTPRKPFYMLEFHRKVKDGYIDQKANKTNVRNTFENPDSYGPLYITDHTFTTKKNKWISSEIKPDGSSNFIILRIKNLPSNLGDPEERDKIESRFKSYFMEGRRPDDPTKVQLEAMLEFEAQAAQVFRDKYRNYDDISVSDSFKPRKHGNKTSSNKGTYVSYDPDEKFPLKESSLKSDHNDGYGWNRERWKYERLETLDKRGTLVIYGYRDDSDKLEKAMELFANISKFADRYNNFHSNKLQIVKIAKSREDMFASLSGSYHIDEFWDSDHVVFKRVVTAFELRGNMPDRKLIRKWKKYVPHARKIYGRLNDLKSTYSFSYSNYHSWMDGFLEDKKHLIDKSALRDLERIKGYILKYPVLTWLERGSPSLNGLGSVLDLEKELREYIEDRPSIDPHLLYRYKVKKNQQDDGT